MSFFVLIPLLVPLVVCDWQYESINWKQSKSLGTFPKMTSVTYLDGPKNRDSENVNVPLWMNNDAQSVLAPVDHFTVISNVQLDRETPALDPDVYQLSDTVVETAIIPMSTSKDETEALAQSNYEPSLSIDETVFTAPRPIEPFRYVYASPPTPIVAEQSQHEIVQQQHPNIAINYRQPAHTGVISSEPPSNKDTYQPSRQQEVYSEVSEETIIPSMKQLFGDDFVTNLAHMLRNLKEFQTKETNEDGKVGGNNNNNVRLQASPNVSSAKWQNDNFVPNNNNNDLVLTQEYGKHAVPDRVNYPLPNAVTPFPNMGNRKQPQAPSSQNTPNVAGPPPNKGLYPFSADYWRQIVENQRRKPRPVYTAPVPVEPTRSAPLQLNDRYNRQTPDMNTVFGIKVNQESSEGDLPLLGQSSLATIKCLDRAITIGRNELSKIACCGDQAYNVEKLVCINSQVVSNNNQHLSLPTGAPVQSLPKVVAKINMAGLDLDYRRLNRKPKVDLCGKVYYNTEERTCCNKKLYNKKPGQVCCGGYNYAESYINVMECCGIIPYDITRHACLAKNMVIPMDF